MTLQQKLLAKQSKKGFTLVELVVVIAILGILAAIAIPAVIGIINSANESQAKTDASSISAALKNYYAEIVAGTINKDNKGSSTDTNLPDKNASTSAKKTGAQNATVDGALNYYGLKDLSNDEKLKDFVVDKDSGTVYAVVDSNKPANAKTTFTKSSALKDLGYGSSTTGTGTGTGTGTP